MSLHRRCALLAAVVLVTLAPAACGNDDDGGSAIGASDATELVGVFSITPGACGDGGATGSYFRMVQPGGTNEAGPFVANGDVPCPDKTWTLLSPGGDGGLRTGAYQTQPEPPFDAGGNALGSSITEPQRWFAVAFGLATNERDPQTGEAAGRPTIERVGRTLRGDLSALGAAWNGQHFNQGAPKPGGERPGHTTGPTGTFDPDTGAYTLDWSSEIAGGPFNGFTGIWHLEGTFEPR